MNCVGGIGLLVDQKLIKLRAVCSAVENDSANQESKTVKSCLPAGAHLTTSDGQSYSPVATAPGFVH